MGYYKGDPGFLSGMLKIGSIMPGPIGVASRSLGGLMKTDKATVPTHVTAAARSAAPAVSRANARVGAIMRHPGTAIMPGGARTGSMHITGAHVLHTHISRRTGLEVRGRARRMNPYNPRALNRAVRRATRFAHMAKRVLRFVSAKPVKGRAIFRVHRKRKV